MISLYNLFEGKIIEPRLPGWTQGSVQSPIGGFGYPNMVQPNPAPATQTSTLSLQKQQDDAARRANISPSRNIKNPNALVQSGQRNPTAAIGV